MSDKYTVKDLVRISRHSMFEILNQVSGVPVGHAVRCFKWKDWIVVSSWRYLFSLTAIKIENVSFLRKIYDAVAIREFDNVMNRERQSRRRFTKAVERYGGTTIPDGVSDLDIYRLAVADLYTPKAPNSDLDAAVGLYLQQKKDLLASPCLGKLAETLYGLVAQPNWEDQYNDELKALRFEAALKSDTAWANARWIAGHSSVTSDDLRSAIHRRKAIRRRRPSDATHPEYNLTDVQRCFPVKAKGLVKKYLSSKA